ncbi:Shikimate kinase [Halioglobus japonicus]|nr:Shikimate kinase [Halioglobus japonicus]
MSPPTPNIVLIGMPGSGKSTVGVVLAKMLSYDFLDTDLLIQSSQQRPLQDIVDNDGHLALRTIEEDVLLSIDVERTVIATGGSAVYSEPAMAHLSATGIIVFLEIDLASLQQRIHNFGSRGLAKRPEQSLADLFTEREALYRQVAQITVNCCGLTQEEVCAEIIGRITNGF